MTDRQRLDAAITASSRSRRSAVWRKRSNSSNPPSSAMIDAAVSMATCAAGLR